MSVVLTQVGHGFVPGQLLFRNVTARLERGSSYALVGPSGSGKSTLLSIIAGWVEPSEGAVQNPPEAIISWVFQNPHGVAKRTVLDHVALPLVARGYSRADANRQSLELLASFGLEQHSDQPFSALSGGEAQRLMLARGLATEPDIFLVDEPTAQLDLHTADTVNATLGALTGTGSVVIVATHDARTRDSCDQVIDLGDFQ